MTKPRTLLAGVVCVLFLGAGNSHAADEFEELETMQRFISLVSDYVEFNHRWLELIDSRDGVAQMSAEGISEIHEERGRPLEAIPALRELARQYPKGSTARRAIHWKIKDIYKDAGQFDKALEEIEAFSAN